MSRLAFLASDDLKNGMNVAVLTPKCPDCGLWQLVARGKISKVEHQSSTTFVELGGARYSLGYATGREVVPAGQETHWLNLSKNILCNHR